MILKRGVEYHFEGSKEVIKSISHKESPCNDYHIGIEKACHEFKVCT